MYMNGKETILSRQSFGECPVGMTVDELAQIVQALAKVAPIPSVAVVGACSPSIPSNGLPLWCSFQG